MTARKLRRLDFFKDDAGLWRWRVRASNGTVVATSGEGHKELPNCLRAYLSVAWISNESIEQGLMYHGYKVESWGNINGTPVLKRIHPSTI